jgi:ubiquinone/menaquinone biosynthesis C-methylase UbiE
MRLDRPALDKDEVARNWAGRAPAWNRWADRIVEFAERFNQPLIEAAGIAPGMAVLDLASGAGEPALSIARAVGPEGRVVATDLVDDMLAGARRRATAAGLDNLECHIVDMEALAFSEASFDRVTCRFGIMFVPDPVQAMAEALRVLRPGGASAWMVWGPIADTTVFDVTQREVRAELGLPHEPNLPQFSFGRAAAGFAEVAETELRYTPKPPAGSRFWEANVEMSFGAEVDKLSVNERRRLDARLESAFDAYLDGDRYRLTAHVRIGTGRRPA